MAFGSVRVKNTSIRIYNVGSICLCQIFRAENFEKFQIRSGKEIHHIEKSKFSLFAICL